MDAPLLNATVPGPQRKSTRTRRPNVTLDLEGVHLERLRGKKDARSGFASYVSARVREITDLLSDERNLQAVKENLVHAIKAFDNFKNAHYDYWREVKDEKGAAECHEYLSKHIDDFSAFRQQVSNWIAVAEDNLLSVAPQVVASINPEDSVSNVGLQAHSSTSKHSKQSSRTSCRGSRAERLRDPMVLNRPSQRHRPLLPRCRAVNAYVENIILVWMPLPRTSSPACAYSAKGTTP